MRIAVIGCGSIGKRHIGNLQQLGVRDIVACDPRPDRRREVTERFGLHQVHEDYRKAISAPVDAVVVCTPPSGHLEPAIAAAEAGCHLLVEKPLSDHLEGVDHLIDLCERRQLVLMTAYNMRFWSPIIKMKELMDEAKIGRVLTGRVAMSGYLPDFHPSDDPREYYMFHRALGGGVLLDMTHAIDLTCWLLGEVAAVSCFNHKISQLPMDADDVALLLLRFESGAVVDMHLDLLGRAARKSCELIGEDGTILWDTASNEVQLYEAKTKDWVRFDCEEDYNGVYVAEMRHFLDCVQHGTPPLIDGAGGRRTLDIVEAARCASAENRTVTLSTTQTVGGST